MYPSRTEPPASQPGAPLGTAGMFWRFIAAAVVMGLSIAMGLVLALALLAF